MNITKIFILTLLLVMIFFLISCQSREVENIVANDWWAAVYTSNQNANYGALFCIFNENGIKNKAHCYFKDIDGNIPDEFDVVSNVR